MATFARSRLRLLGVVALVGASLVLALQALGSDAPTPTLACADTAVFGGDVTCTTTDAEGHSLRWGEASASLDVSGTGLIAPSAVGPSEISLVDGSGVVVASQPITVSPDMELICTEGDVMPIYEIEPAVSDQQPWRYVYAHTTTGERFMPDEPGPFIEPPSDEYDRIQLGEAAQTSRCHVESAAKEALGGKVTWTLTGDIYESQTHTLSIIAPTAGGHWDGLQPATLDATLDVGGVLVTQTVTVYFRGCT